MALLGALALPPAASAAWNQPAGGASPINQSGDQDANRPSLAEVGGVPHVAWVEPDGTNDEVRVARFDAGINGWVQPWAGVSATSGGINQSTAQSANTPSLASIGGVPFVAWTEFDSTNDELRVARLNTATNAWEQPWTGVGATSGGINQSTTRSAEDPSLASIGGVPHVAWRETDGTNFEVRVARLNTVTNAWEQPWTGVGATSGGINQSTAHDARFETSLASIAGVPYVGWRESDGTNDELRVARLDGVTWQQPWAGVSATSGGINQSTTETAGHPSLASIAGVPYLAWWENETTNTEMRVARLTGNAWTQPWSGVSDTSGGVNHSSTNNASDGSLASVGGVPYVSFRENDGTSDEARVARLSGDAWTQPWLGVTATSGGINQSTSENGNQTSLASLEGFPYVAWRENDGGGREIRVSRLEPEFISLSANPSETGATLGTTVRTFGIPYPVGFQYGSALENETPTETAPAGSESATIARQIGGLSPATSHQFRPFATAGVPAPRVLGPTGTFTTAAAQTSDPGADATPAVFSRYRVSPRVFRAARRGASVAQRRRRPVGTRVSYTLSEAATVRFRVRRRAKGRRARGRCRRQTRRNRSRPRCVRFVKVRGRFEHAGQAGANEFRFTGRLRGRRLRPRRYRLQARAVDAAGNRSPVARRKFRIVRR